MSKGQKVREEGLAMFRQGYSTSAVVTALGVNDSTARRWLKLVDPTDRRRGGPGRPALKAQHTNTKKGCVLIRATPKARAHLRELASILGIPMEEALDRELERAKAGRLDPLWEEAQREIAAGKTRPLNEVLDDKSVS